MSTELTDIKKDILHLTKELVLFRTTEDRPEELQKCISYIKHYFADSKVKIKELNIRGKPSLFIAFNNRKKQTLILNGHIDVVEGNDNQFNAEEKNGYLYGRGTNDMKASIAVFMVLMKNLARKINPPAVALLVVSDEETGGQYGTKEWLKRGYKCTIAIAGEPSRFHLETKHKGPLQVRIISQGTYGHSSRPWQGTNAIDKLIKQYERFKEDIPQPTRTRKWHASINPTYILSPGPYNVTPARAEMVLDIRTNEEWTNRKLIERLKKLNIKYEIILNNQMLFNLNKNRYIKNLKKVAEKILERKVKYIKSAGGSDAQFFSGKGMTALNFGPIGRNHHKSNEYVEIESLPIYYQILDRYVQTICN